MNDQTPITYPQNPPIHSMAIISLVASIAGLTVIPTMGSIIGVITGHLARRDMRATPGRYSGEGVALAGVVLGWIGVGLGVLGICVAVGFFALWLGGLLAFMNFAPPDAIFNF